MSERFHEEFISPDEIQEELELQGQEMDIDIQEEMEQHQSNYEAGDYEEHEEGDYQQEHENYQEEQVEIEDDSIQGFFTHNEPVFTLAIHPSLPLIVSGGSDDKSYLWDFSTGELTSHLGVHSDSVVSCAFSFDGRFIASGGMDGKIHIFEITTKEVETRDGNIITKDVDLFVSQTVELEGPSEVTWLDWHPRGNILIVGSEDGTIWMYSLPTGKCMNVFSGNVETSSCGTFTPDGKLIVSGSNDGSITIWDPKTGI